MFVPKPASVRRPSLSIASILIVFWVADATLADPLVPLQRRVPAPLANHPGNVFLSGESVSVTLPASNSPWHLSDYHGTQLSEVAAAGRVNLGKLPVGFYRLDSAQGSNWISLAVLSPLRAPTPTDSPIALDVAMSWFYKEPSMDAVANLCALAGINWVRDRLNWAQIEPENGRFTSRTQYDASAAAQAQAGLRVLQVNHLSPPWANPNTKRFPPDLRDVYEFYRAVAVRWQGIVQAFEPWNEADIPMFGGHTGAEMASLQKAAYLGLKAGSPNVIACLNVFALHNKAQLQDLDANQAWPYFDTFNLHHYVAFDQYPTAYADFRAVSAGKPLWVTECSLPVPRARHDKRQEPTDADLKVQAERVAKTFACSIHQDAIVTFYFLLPHYVEGQTQFGILRPDLTPRPAYVALAAVGRFLAGAKPLGQTASRDPAVRGFLFDTRADGQPHKVLVAWSTNQSAILDLPVSPTDVFDHLGRAQPSTRTLKLSSAPLFALLPATSIQALPLSRPPSPASQRAGAPCAVVLQSLWPEDKVDLKASAYRLENEGETSIPVFAYNFGRSQQRGTFHVQVPPGWKVDFPEALELAPSERAALSLRIKPEPSDSPDAPAVVHLEADLGAEGKAVLSIRVLAPKLSVR